MCNCITLQAWHWDIGIQHAALGTCMSPIRGPQTVLRCSWRRTTLWLWPSVSSPPPFAFLPGTQGGSHSDQCLWGLIRNLFQSSCASMCITWKACLLGDPGGFCSEIQNLLHLSTLTPCGQCCDCTCQHSRQPPTSPLSYPVQTETHRAKWSFHPFFQNTHAEWVFSTLELFMYHFQGFCHIHIPTFLVFTKHFYLNWL